MTERTESTGGGQWAREADGPVDCDAIFSILADNTVAASKLLCGRALLLVGLGPPPAATCS